MFEEEEGDEEEGDETTVGWGVEPEADEEYLPGASDSAGTSTAGRNTTDKKKSKYVIVRDQGRPYPPQFEQAPHGIRRKSLDVCFLSQIHGEYIWHGLTPKRQSKKDPNNIEIEGF